MKKVDSYGWTDTLCEIENSLCMDYSSLIALLQSFNVSCTVAYITDINGKPTTECYIYYETKDECNKAIKSLKQYIKNNLTYDVIGNGQYKLGNKQYPCNHLDILIMGKEFADNGI
jgi:hypothetical protein